MRLPIVRMQFEILVNRENSNRSQDEHTRIVEALRQCDAEGAETAMRLHVRRSWELLASLPVELFA